MERLSIKGHIRPKSSDSISHSKIGLGFEKLDRGVFDPNKAYDKIAAIGVKWIRLQSGWLRCEKERGVYDFAWLDDIVDNLIKRGMRPWLNLSYGNPLYTPRAAVFFGAVGCPPINSDDEWTGWLNYVKAIATHFKGRITHYEIWNEPDIGGRWRRATPEEDKGAVASEYAHFCNVTADALHEADPDAKALGFGIAYLHKLDYVNEGLSCGMLDHIDAITFHSYSASDEVRPERIRDLKRLCRAHGRDIEIIQGETGCQSRSDGSGALKGMAWTPEKQVKHQLRNMIIDLGEDVGFTSYFSTVDMIEALYGIVGDKASYLDYGYFGVLGAEFDENGVSTGDYTPKPSYYSLQTLASVFAEDFEPAELPIVRRVLKSGRVAGEDCQDRTVITYGFRKPNGSRAFAYWNAVPILTSTYEGTVSFACYCVSDTEQISLVDMSDGCVYALPESMVEPIPGGGVLLKSIPITDSPMLLTFGDFADM